MTDHVPYTARNSERLPETARALANYAPGAAAVQRESDRAARIRQAVALRISARMDESFDADTSGDPFRPGVDALKNRLLQVREACEVFALHRSDASFRGMIEGLLMFKVITPVQHRGLRQLLDSAYNYRLKELQQ